MRQLAFRAAVLTACLLVTADAWAVVPLRASPRQMILSLLPYILAGLLALTILGALMRWGIRVWVPRLRARGVRHPLLVVSLFPVTGILAVGGGILVALWRPAPQPDAAPSTRLEESWATFMGTCQRTGTIAPSRTPTKAERIWSFCDGLSRAPFAASSAVADGRVYVGSDNRKLYCFDARTGGVLWEFMAAFPIFASPVIAGGCVYVAEGLHETSQAKVHCLDAATGTPRWAFPTTSHVEFSPSVHAGRLYVGAGEDGLYCLDAATGQRVWQVAGVHVDMCPAVTGGAVLFGSVYGEPAIHCVDARDGRPLWKRRTPYGVCGSPSTDGKRVYFGLGNGTFEASHAQPKGAVWCLAVADGRVLWTRELPDAVLTTVALAYGTACCGCRDGKLYCLDAESGEIRWSFATGDSVLSSPAVLDGRVIFGSNDACVYCINVVTGAEVWRYDTSQVAFNTDARVISSPAVADGQVYVGSMNFHFFCLGDRRCASAPGNGEGDDMRKEKSTNSLGR